MVKFKEKLNRHKSSANYQDTFNILMMKFNRNRQVAIRMAFFTFCFKRWRDVNFIDLFNKILISGVDYTTDS